MLIIRRSNCINTASGIVFCVSDCPDVQVEKFLLNLHSGRSLTENTIPDAVLIQYAGQSLTENNIPDAVLIQFDLLMMNTELLETCREL